MSEVSPQSCVWCFVLSPILCTHINIICQRARVSEEFWCDLMCCRVSQPMTWKYANFSYKVVILCGFPFFGDIIGDMNKTNSKDPSCCNTSSIRGDTSKFDLGPRV
jgi:hypothetical protein